MGYGREVVIWVGGASPKQVCPAGGAGLELLWCGARWGRQAGETICRGVPGRGSGAAKVGGECQNWLSPASGQLD